MWLFLAILSGLLYTTSGLISRHVLKSGRDSWAFSFFYSAVGALISLPFALGVYAYKGEFTLPEATFGWVVMIIVGLLIILQNFLSFRASNYIEASLNGTITKFRLIWIFILGIILLDEQFTLLKLSGTILTVLAGSLLLIGFKKPESMKGMFLSFMATFVYGTAIILYKILFDFFSVWTLTLFVTFLTPMILNLIIMPNSVSRITKLAKDNGKMTFIACAFGALANLSLNGALLLGEATKVPAMVESFLVLTLIGEYIVLKERTKVWMKITAILLASIGALLIKLG